MRRLWCSSQATYRPSSRRLIQSTILQRQAHNNLDPNRRTSGFARRQRRGQQPEQHNDQKSTPSQPPEGQKDKVASALQASSTSDSNLLSAPVNLPEDRHGILQPGHPAMGILANSSIVVQRQLEMMNVLMGFEQANRYVMMDAEGNHIGYLAEQDHGIGSTVARQAFRTHRSFTTHVFDREEREVLRFHRPFAWISSRIKVYDATNSGGTSHVDSTVLQGTSAGSISSQMSARVSPLHVADMRVIGEAEQQWALLRRKYNLFLSRPLSSEPLSSNLPRLGSGSRPVPSSSTALQTTDASTHGFAQFASVDEPFLSWDFSLLSESGNLIGSVNRNFAGFGREIFTDTGVYALRMDAAALAAEPRHMISQTNSSGEPSAEGMTLDQRAVMLATAVSVDFDYFSRHSGAGVGGGFMPMWMPFGWGGAGAEAGAGGAAGEAGAAGGAAAGSVEEGSAAATRAAQEGARSVGAGEGAIAGAGSMAGYEAMQGARERYSGEDQPPPVEEAAPFLCEDGSPSRNESQGTANQGEDNDFWDDNDGNSGGPPASGGGDGGDGPDIGGGDGGGFDLDDFF